MNKPLRILITEDSEEDTLLIVRELRKEGLNPTFERVDTPEGLNAAFDKQSWDVVLSDYVMPHFSGLAALKIVQERGLELPFIVVSGKIDEETAIEAMKAGAHDYVFKSNLKRLVPSIKRELQEVEVQRERKRAEEELRKSEERYRKLVTSVTDYIYTVKVENGRPVKTIHGPGCVSVTGYTAEEYETNPNLWYKMIYEEDRKAVLKQAEKVLSGERVPPLEHRIIHRDGSIHWIMNTPVARFSEKGQLVAYDGLIADITGRKRAEETLKASREYAKNIIDSSMDMIIAVDKNRRITEFNLAAQETFSYSKEEILGKHVDLLYSDPNQGLKIHEMTLVNGRHVQEVINRRKNGELFPSFLSASVLRDARGEVVGVMGVSRDITERKRLEEQFLQAQKMEAIGRFSGGIAHDFNNMLTAIIGYSGLLLSNLPQDDPSRADVEEIKKAGEHASALTRQLLAFSRKQVLQSQVINLNTLVTEMKKMLKRIIGEDIRLVTSLEPKLDNLKVDPGQIEQVLMNLVVNAHDAMPKGGTITLKTENVTIDEEYVKVKPEARPGKFVSLSVQDTGSGMDKETLQHLFEPFFTTKETGKGTGLGLSTVYGIVKQHNGWLNVYSELGKGTIFKIYLPVFSIEETPAR